MLLASRLQSGISGNGGCTKCVKLAGLYLFLSAVVGIAGFMWKYA
jgi:hypothetical protein